MTQMRSPATMFEAGWAASLCRIAGESGRRETALWAPLKQCSPHSAFSHLFRRLFPLSAWTIPYVSPRPEFHSDLRRSQARVVSDPEVMFSVVEGQAGREWLEPTS
jgi:hypothetical protein